MESLDKKTEEVQEDVAKADDEPTSSNKIDEPSKKLLKLSSNTVADNCDDAREDKVSKSESFDDDEPTSSNKLDEPSKKLLKLSSNAVADNCDDAREDKVSKSESFDDDEPTSSNKIDEPCKKLLKLSSNTVSDNCDDAREGKVSKIESFDEPTSSNKIDEPSKKLLKLSSNAVADNCDDAREDKVSKSENFDDDEPTSSNKIDEPSKKLLSSNAVADNCEEPIQDRATIISRFFNSRPDDLETSTAGLKRFKRIPLFIVDHHGDVSDLVNACLVHRFLPMENNTLLRFGSHANMLITRGIAASRYCSTDNKLIGFGIENWIMPSCYLGHFNRVIWLKNSWCHQIPVGKYNFKIGYKDNMISVDSTLEYFVAEGNYVPTSELEQARDFELQVVNADSKIPPDPQEMLSAYDSFNYILDIDLDFFSTCNPLLGIYPAADSYTKLADIFHSVSATEADVASISQKRKQELDALKAIFLHLDIKKSFEGLEWPSTDVVTAEVIEKIVDLEQSLKQHYAAEEIDWGLMFSYASNIETNSLPHHISSKAALSLYYIQFQEFLNNLPHPPLIVTIACSSDDDYCPRNQVYSIRDIVVRILHDVFSDKIHGNPIIKYIDNKMSDIDSGRENSGSDGDKHSSDTLSESDGLF